MKQEVLGTVQGIAGALAEEWKMAEPAGEDQPEPTPTVDAGTADDLNRFGRFIGRRRHWKKAYVCLKPGQEINFAAGETK